MQDNDLRHFCLTEHTRQRLLLAKNMANFVVDLGELFHYNGGAI
jgi:hypothetical protein